MARIILVKIGMHGHVNPTLGFTQELVERLVICTRQGSPYGSRLHTQLQVFPKNAPDKQNSTR